MGEGVACAVNHRGGCMSSRYMLVSDMKRICFTVPPVVEPKGRGAEASAPTRLARRLNLVDAVVVGLGAMIGAGVFVAFAPAAQAAGAGLLFGLVVAAAVAYCNAMSSARLAALYPQSGGTYVYARERLGQVWGYIAGWSFVVGKVASCAAIALTLGHYLVPSLEHPLAVAAVVALTVVNLRGIEKTALLTRLIVGVVLVALAAFVVAALVGGVASSAKLSPLGAGGIVGILRAGGDSGAPEGSLGSATFALRTGRAGRRGRRVARRAVVAVGGRQPDGLRDGTQR